MRNSIVNIESVSNNSFGTGFVIDRDEKGVFVLTCAHVLDDVETPVVENVLAKVVAKGSFIDMAVLYVSKLKVDALPLQTQECTNLNVEVIGFSVFNKNLTQKKHIKATLYQELIELHSKEDDLFYTVRKIKANDGFNFDRGNSGSPVICKDSGNVIAMISNKEGSDIGYAIDINNIKEVWKEIPKKLLETKVEPLKQEKKIEPVSGRKEEPTPLPQKKSNSSMGKYLLGLLLITGLGFGVYNSVTPPPPKQNKDKEGRKDKLVEQQELQKQKEVTKLAQKKRKEALKRAARAKELARQQAEAKKRKERQRKPVLHLPPKRPQLIDFSKIRVQDKPKHDLSKLNLEKPLNVAPPKH